MKKILSVVLSLVMLLSVSVATVNAFAAVGSIESTTTSIKVINEVNGQVNDDVIMEQDPTNPRKFTFTYTGDGELIGWEFPGMVKGTDYQILSEEGNAITILVSDAYKGEVIANAIVRYDEEEETTKKETTKKSEKSKSPKTGAAAAAGFVAMGAGAAILTALKKKEDAE